MKAKDVMTSPVISVEPDASVLEAIRIMLQRRVSGLPVINKEGRVVGMLTEGDLLRREETGTQRQRPRWLEFLLGPGKLADEYTRSRGRKVGEIMSDDPRTVSARQDRENDGETSNQAGARRAGRARGRNREPCQPSARPRWCRSRAQARRAERRRHPCVAGGGGSEAALGTDGSHGSDRTRRRDRAVGLDHRRKSASSFDRSRGERARRKRSSRPFGVGSAERGPRVLPGRRSTGSGKGFLIIN